MAPGDRRQQHPWGPQEAGPGPCAFSVCLKHPWASLEPFLGAHPSLCEALYRHYLQRDLHHPNHITPLSNLKPQHVKTTVPCPTRRAHKVQMELVPPMPQPLWPSDHSDTKEPLHVQSCCLDHSSSSPFAPSFSSSYCNLSERPSLTSQERSVPQLCAD